MKKIQVVPTWSFLDADSKQLNPQLFSLLRAIHNSGKLTAATEHIGISYRHGWNLLNTWADFFGVPLVQMQKGRGASLSALGEKLLWAEQRVIARLEPQLDSLASELNTEIHRALADVSPLLKIHASYGYAVALLPKFCEEIQLDLQYKSAEEALISLHKGNCDIAGFHLPAFNNNNTGPKEEFSTWVSHLNPREHKIIRFITRQQGLIVKPGNPLNITKLQDLANNDRQKEPIRFINREKKSGTRALLDYFLNAEKIDPKRIVGYEDEEFTHSAVAAFVASGMADVGMGVEPAARQFGLDFIPLASEHYLLACRQHALQHPAVERLLAIIRQPTFADAVRELPGYTPDYCGDIVTLNSIL